MMSKNDKNHLAKIFYILGYVSLAVILIGVLWIYFFR